ncbi:hypothetical protein ABFS83_08G182800 [Erythranthe nasuta]
MSKAGEEEEEEEDDGEADVSFHDSLDRLLSSTNTSCSCSPSTSEPEADPNFSPDHNEPVPKFPKSVAGNYDVWTSQPLSVEERRLRLLRQMGLARDPSLLRHRHRPSLSLSLASHHSDQFGNNSSKLLDNSSDCVNGGSNRNVRPSGILRSKSDGECNSCQNSEVRTNNSVTDEIRIDVNNNINNDDSNNSNRSNQSPMCCAVSPNKPPKVKIKTDCKRNGSFSNDDELCLIKNLDNGKEFVVNEMKEDGTWEKIQELETGRQFTMEEFTSEMCVGTSPIVQELMRRQNFEDRTNEGLESNHDNGSFDSASKSKKRRNWLSSIKNVANSVKGHNRERRSSDERDTSSGRRSSSATDDSSQEVSFKAGPEKVRVRQYGKSVKELTALYKSQEIKAHNGSIWAVKFSLDGKYLASAGEDCVIHVWEVVENERKGDFFWDKLEDGNFNLLFPEPLLLSPKLDGGLEKKRRGRSSVSRKSISLEQILAPDSVFALSEKPFCSFHGHLDDVLDLSWSKSQKLLSSSMDKTVRLWDLSTKACVKIFSHSDYVTCIQFNPVDDRYFISGSLDAKVRIWSIPDHQVIDWNDLHEMVTAACYTPDGQGALVGSYKGSCCLYNTSENKLLQKSYINLQNKKKKPHQKKITGFQFTPGSTSEVLITSADSRIRVVDGVDLVHKFKGFRNTKSQISSSLTSNGKYLISASEDSHVYVWRHKCESRPNRSKSVAVTNSYEVFHCQDVSMAIPWPGISSRSGGQNGHFNFNPPEDVEGLSEYRTANAANNYLFDRISLTWPEEKLVSIGKNNSKHSPRVSVDLSNGSAWGMVIVTAGLRGEIRTFQNFGLPFRI